MLKIDFSTYSSKFLLKIPTKHANQLLDKIEKLATSIDDVPTINIKGSPPIRRAKSGEYRIVFKIENETLFITTIGHRNDNDVYDRFERSRK